MKDGRPAEAKAACSLLEETRRLAGTSTCVPLCYPEPWPLPAAFAAPTDGKGKLEHPFKYRRIIPSKRDVPRGFPGCRLSTNQPQASRDCRSDSSAVKPPASTSNTDRRTIATTLTGHGVAGSFHQSCRTPVHRCDHVEKLFVSVWFRQQPQGPVAACPRAKALLRAERRAILAGRPQRWPAVRAASAAACCLPDAHRSQPMPQPGLKAR